MAVPGGRRRWLRAGVLSAALTLGVQALSAGLLAGVGAGVALASGPVPPPSPVNPAPKVLTVTTPGPTQVSGNLSTDTVWSPQGSPYMVSGLTIPAGVELTLLPGTVVKIGWHASINVFGRLLALGDPGSHVVITSDRDDSVMGDSNGDGSATSAAPGDWYRVGAGQGGVAVFDYTDVRYGGYGSACSAYGALGAASGSELIVANSSVTESGQRGGAGRDGLQRVRRGLQQLFRQLVHGRGRDAARRA